MKTELEKCLAGETFNGGDKELAAMALTLKITKGIEQRRLCRCRTKEKYPTEIIRKIGENVHIDIDFHCEYGKHIFVGNKVVINMNCTFVDNNIIEIGNNVDCVQLQKALYTVPTRQSKRKNGR